MANEEHSLLMNELKKKNRITQFTEQQICFPETIKGYWETKDSLFPQYSSDKILLPFKF